MPYVIVFQLVKARRVETATKPNATDALALVEALRRERQVIEFIRSPGGALLDPDSLRLLADQEEEARRRLALRRGGGR
jgi:hypothetical protein